MQYSARSNRCAAEHCLPMRLADKMLIICPSILLAAQWQSELYEKFGEIALVFGHDIDSSLAWECSRLITTYEMLRHPFHAEEILRQRYELLILDEAHFLNEEENADILGTVRDRKSTRLN